MGDGFAEIEFETLVLGRHLSPPRRADGTTYLERSAYTLLNRLLDEGPMSIRQLSDAFGLDASTLNRQTAAMMRAGLVERISDPDGGLARKFLVTDAGRERVSAERASNVAGIERVMQDWSSEDVRTLATLIRRFNIDIEEREGRSWPRS